VSEVAAGPLTQQGLELIDDESGDWAKHDQAIEIFRDAVQQGEAAAPRALACALAERGRLDDAIALLEPIVAEGRLDLAGLLADIFDDADNTERAEHFYLLAVEQGDLEALNDYGVFLVAEERFEEAIPVYERAIAAGDTLAAGNLVSLYAEDLDDLPKALELGLQYLDEAKPKTYSALAAVRQRLGELDEAERLYARAIELDAPDAHLHMAWFLQDHRDDLARVEAEFVKARENDELGWGYHLGKFLIDQERYDEAAGVLAHAAHWGDLDAQQLLEEYFEEVPADPS
jgi:Tfp pilus assembly protein PilF